MDAEGKVIDDPLAAACGVRLLYEVGPILVIQKPAGLATQAPPGIDSAEVRVKRLLRARSGADENTRIYLGVPHRLDRAASGALAFATTRRGARSLSKQFERRTVQKLYWAIVVGAVDPPKGTWRDYLCKVYGQPLAAVVPADHPHARAAVLHYRTLGGGSWTRASSADTAFTQLEIELETGRTHQIRVQAASRGHAIVGDAPYGSRLDFGPVMADERQRPIALLARMLAFVHPDTRTRVSVISPPPANWPPPEAV